MNKFTGILAFMLVLAIFAGTASSEEIIADANMPIRWHASAGTGI